MKNQIVFYKTALKISDKNKGEAEILEEATKQVFESGKTLNPLDVKRIDIREGETIVYFSAEPTLKRTGKRTMLAKASIPKAFKVVKEKEVWALP